MTHEQWQSQLDYVITLLGFGVGAGAFIKFPFYCMRNGGGAFLILFMFFTIIGTIPCVFLEMTIGQFSQSGPIKVWNMCPAFKGIGIGGAIVSWIFTSYYNVNFTWYMYYFYHSFSHNLPWDSCDNTWNTAACMYSKNDLNISNGATSNTTDARLSFNETKGKMPAAEEFWKFQMHGQSDGLETLGGLRWHLVGCLAVTSVILFLWIFRGIRVSGKSLFVGFYQLVYVTVILPYILILVFLIRGCLLPGSAEGIYYYIYPRFDKLADPKIWIQSCSYALFSMGISMGCLVTMSGHNRKDNNCFRDAIIICLMDSLSNVFFGFAFFAIVGNVAYQRGVTVEAFQSSVYDLAFIVYPEVISALPLPQLWSVLTFVILMSLAIDSMVPGVEIIISALEDTSPRLMKRRWLIIGAVLLSLFLFGLIYISQGGIYVVTLIDWYTYFPSTAVFGLLECIAVGWCYGASGSGNTLINSMSIDPRKWDTMQCVNHASESDHPIPLVAFYSKHGQGQFYPGTFMGIQRFQEDIRTMWGKTIPRIMVISIKFVCPLFLVVICCYTFYSYRPPKYGDYIYPTWATAVGWLISFSSLLPFPIVFIWTVYKAAGATMKEKLKTSLEPNEYWSRSELEEEFTDVLQPMVKLEKTFTEGGKISTCPNI